MSTGIVVVFRKKGRSHALFLKMSHQLVAFLRVNMLILRKKRLLSDNIINHATG